jgi:raffinose/stachyose/melibiose transport system permease protein
MGAANNAGRRRLRLPALQVVYVLPALLLVGVFIYLPAVEDACWSLYRWNAINPSSVFVGLGNYTTMLAAPTFWSALLNNTAYAVVSLTVQVACALVLAAVLEARVFPGRLAAFFRVCLFLPSLLPITAIGVLWQLIYDPTIGPIDQALSGLGFDQFAHAWLGENATAIWAVIAVSQWQWTGYLMVLFVVAIRSVPRELYEAMAIDGAGRIRQFWHVTVPCVRETTLVLVMITIFGAYKVFDIVWVMTRGGPSASSETLATYMYRAAFLTDEAGYASAIATAIFMITFVVGVVQIRLQREE